MNAVTVLPRTIPEPKMRRLPTSAAQRATLGLLTKLAPPLMSYLYFKPSRYVGSREEREVLAQAIIRKEHGIVRYEWESDLPWEKRPDRTVLLVHGWAGAAAQMTAFVQPLLAAGLRVVAIDMPAHGRAPGERTNLLEMASLVRQLAPEAVIAHSLGGTSVLVALQEGIPSTKLVLVSTGAVVDTYPERFAEAIGAGSAAGRRFKAQLMQEFGRHVLRPVEHLPHVATPTLVVHDVDDSEAPYSNALAIAAALPNSRIVSTAGLGHRRLLREPAVIHEVVSFLREL